MSRYFVKSNEDNSILTVIEWDGLSQIYTGSQYYLELENTSSYLVPIEIQYVETEFTNMPRYAGDFNGIFTGELSGSISINGESLKTVINSTEYGSLSYFSGSNQQLINKLSIDVVNSSSYFSLNDYENTSQIILANASRTRLYSSSFNRILNDNISNYVFKLKDKNTPSFKEFLVSDTEITSVGNNKYLILDVNELASYTDDYYYYENKSDIDYSRLANTPWHIDIDLGDKAQAGNFYGNFSGDIDIVSASMDSLLVTGSIDVTGSLIFNGEKIESLLNNTKFGSVNFNSSTDTEECPYPLSFRINSNDWRSTVADGYSDFPATKLTFALNLLMSSSGPVAEYVERKKVLYDIIFNGYIDSTISLKSDSIQKTIKRFLVKGGTYYRADITPGPTATIKYVTSVQFGSKKSLIYTDGDPSTPGNPNEWLGLDSDILEKFDTILNDRPGTYTYLEYVQLDVEEYYSNFDQQYYGGNFGCYNNCIDINGIAVGVRPKDFNQVDFGEKFVLDVEVKDYSKRKKILVLDKSQDVIVPSWTRKTTIYTIGAGGGGGGGAAGYKHSDDFRFRGATATYAGAYEHPNLTIRQAYFDLLEDYIFKCGHEQVSGGGGGAGGNISISSFDFNTIKGNDELTVIIGDGGAGGDGISYEDDRNITLEEAFPNTTIEQLARLRFNEIKFSMGYVLPIILPDATKYTKLDYACGKIADWGIKYNGEKGGDTSVWLKNSPSTSPIILASGGLGGSSGTAIRNAYSTYHRLCVYQSHQYDITISNGGGSLKLNSFGNEVRIGGPGGYGMSMPQTIKYPDRFSQVYETYPTVDNKSINLNKAPNIPWSNNTDIPGLKLPHGHSSIDMNSIDVYKKTSFGTAEQLAPPGGGGGCGVTYYGVDTRDLNEYYQNVIETPVTEDNLWWNDVMKGWRNGILPSDFTQVISDMVVDKITLGYGGKITINPTLFDDVDSDGVRHTVTLSDGGNGGYATYGISKDAQFGNTIPNTITSPGIGSGGGGGAAAFITDWANRESGATGQKGGNGADGLVIIVFES
jgi:hypothetical protein